MHPADALLVTGYWLPVKDQNQATRNKQGGYMYETFEIILAGFGGQGILTAGSILAYAGMLENKHVSWLPSYGPEMRGGTANCHVIVSEKLIASPILNSSDALIVMNKPSLEKFEKSVRSGGMIIADSSIIQDREERRDDISYHLVPATKIASELGNKAFANIVILGKLIKKTGILSIDSIVKTLERVLPPHKHFLIPKEIEALKQGMACK
jgi:2-oxoglutarate ferredoxin oxidoreductase subunit gamma